jgi:hypothetical protein
MDSTRFIGDDTQTDDVEQRKNQPENIGFTAEEVEFGRLKVTRNRFLRGVAKIMINNELKHLHGSAEENGNYSCLL